MVQPLKAVGLALQVVIEVRILARSGLVLTCRSLATFDPLGIPARRVANPRHSWAMAAVRALPSGREAALGA